MHRAPHLESPESCSPRELDEFERVLREGFDNSDARLPTRIRRARCLAFHRSSDGDLAAIAGIKAPDSRYRIDLFERAAAGVDGSRYETELGWVYVTEEHRGRGLGEHLCRSLLASTESGGVFATTRPDNAAMIRILRRLGFHRTGDPFRHPRRPEELALFLRSPLAPQS